MFHKFPSGTDISTLPEKFNNPFGYKPDRLSLLASNLVRDYLNGCDFWIEELKKGKMFGVSVLKNQAGEIGFIAAFSGRVNSDFNDDFFVKPVYDIVDKDDYYLLKDEEIVSVSKHILRLENSPRYSSIKQNLENISLTAQKEMSMLKESAKKAKIRREELRKQNISQSVSLQLIRESQFEKAEIKRKKTFFDQEILKAENEIKNYQTEIENLKRQRALLSDNLQKHIFENVVFLNFAGEKQTAAALFQQSRNTLPPSGAGDCAAPKLLQAAIINGFKPLTIAEFWVGGDMALRKDGLFYPACKEKCQPILQFMLRGLTVDKLPDYEISAFNLKPSIIFEDEYILAVNKPSGILSVSGKKNIPSVYDYYKAILQTNNVFVVHRLDCDTSGILLIAKDLISYKNLQSQFALHTVKKTYRAVLTGHIPEKQGKISLPLIADINERPLQKVDYIFGKQAVTYYKVVKETLNETEILFFPQTGRTHQLRVHAAHKEGLNCPIKGDGLYGNKSDRLYLHAESIEFLHPATGERKKIVVVDHSVYAK